MIANIAMRWTQRQEEENQVASEGKEIQGYKRNIGECIKDNIKQYGRSLSNHVFNHGIWMGVVCTFIKKFLVHET